MAAEVSSMVKSNGSSSEILITRDLLGQFSKVRNNNKDLDLKDFHGLHMSLDLKTDVQRCNSPNSPLSSSSSLENKSHNKYKEPPPLPLKFLEEESSRNLELQLLPSTSSKSSNCQSVCTLDKVKFALKRAEKDTLITTTKKRNYHYEELHKDHLQQLLVPKKSEEIKMMSSSSSSSSDSSSSTSGMFAAGCPGCLMYVMTLKTNPICPRCNSTVPSPLPLKKKPRIDLNASI